VPLDNDSEERQLWVNFTIIDGTLRRHFGKGAPAHLRAKRAAPPLLHS
jgi:hypothetical protein